MIDLAAGSLPFIEVAIPDFIVIRLCRIREYKIPVEILFDRLHKAVADAYRQVGVRYLTHRLLDGNEIGHVRMPVVDHQHQRPTAASALLD